jgi:hypothetical protein
MAKANRVHSTPPISTSKIQSKPPVISTTKGNAIEIRGHLRPSVVQKLCAQYEETLIAFKTAHQAFCDAETAASKESPRADSSIRPTKRNLDDVGSHIRGGTRIPVTSREIKNQIKSLRSNRYKNEKKDGGQVLTISDKVFPLTARQKAQLARVQARLPLALAYEAELAAIQKRLRVKELDDAVNIPSSKLGPLALRIASLESRDRHDMLAKARICEIDPDMDEVSGDIANSIARDFVRLSAAGLV